MENETDAPPVDILGIPVTPQTLEQAVARVAARIDARERAYVCAASVHPVVASLSDDAVRAALTGADMVTTDGMPLVWLCRVKGRRAERVYGPDLMLALCARSLETGWRHFFLGGTDDTLDRLTARLEERFPGLAVAGTWAPPFRPLTAAEEAAMAARLAEAAPDILWVGLGAPKQEVWMAHHRSMLDCPVMIGVGAAFDFHAGTKPQAPVWMRRGGLEWLFRLISEPRRLWRRYLIGNAVFLAALCLQATGLTSCSAASRRRSDGRRRGRR